MAVEGCARIVKILMFIFNFVFFVAGIIVLAMGIYVNLQLDDFTSILPSFSFLSAGNLLIACGVIVMIVGFLGCCGAIKESACMLLIFFFLLLLILILEIVAGALAFTYRSQVEGFVVMDLQTGLSSYNSSESITKAWDTMQQKFKCCGINGSSDWASSNVTFEGNAMYPDSCCQTYAMGCASKMVPVPAYTEGCQDGLIKFLEDNIYIVGAVGIAFGLIQIFGMVFSLLLYIQLKGE